MEEKSYSRHLKMTDGRLVDLGGISALQRGQNPVGSFRHAHFWQHMDVVPQRRIDLGQAIVFRNRGSETMPSLLGSNV